MICPDVNLLLYSINESFDQHASAQNWWNTVLSGSQPVGLSHLVVLGFLRLSTSRKVFTNPLTTEQAIEVIDSWVAQPNVKFFSPTESHWKVLKDMLRNGTVIGNLATDAHLAALAFEYGMVIYSNDTDFSRFPGIQVVNPLQEE